MSNTLVLGPSESRAAMMAPDEPAPTTMWFPMVCAAQPSQHNFSTIPFAAVHMNAFRTKLTSATRRCALPFSLYFEPMPCLRVYYDGVASAFGTIFAVFPPVIPQRSWTQFDVM